MDGKRGSKRRADGGKEDGLCDKHDLMEQKRNQGGRLGLHADMRRTRKYMNVGRRLRSFAVVSSFLGFVLVRDAKNRHFKMFSGTYDPSALSCIIRWCDEAGFVEIQYPMY